MGTTLYYEVEPGIHEGLYDHEGYLALVLVDGTETSTWSAETAAAMVGVRPRCECGWRGTYHSRRSLPAVDEPYMAQWQRHAERFLAEAHT